MQSFNFRNRYLRFLFLPFTSIYYILITVRNKCYNKNIFKSHKFPVPVISTGNITTGGTGKTPFTIYLAGKLKSRYQKIAVVSRGYHRKSKGLIVVSDGKGNTGSVEQCGDEPVLIAKKLPDAVVIVSENRVKGVARAVNDFSCDLVLLDDAFQHRRIYRDCDIVLINKKAPLFSDFMIPAGNLREPLSQLKRADVIIFTNADNNIENDDSNLLNKYYSGPVFTCRYSTESYIGMKSDEKYSIEDLKGKPVIAFCGIAEPQLFKQLLLKQGIEIKDMHIFPDHYSYTESDIEKISNKAGELKCDFVITTEKDLVKVKWPRESTSKIVALGLKISIKNEQNMLDKVEEYIDNR
jgi:tetraacyldisaccharide 4'-kinase